MGLDRIPESVKNTRNSMIILRSYIQSGANHSYSTTITPTKSHEP